MGWNQRVIVKEITSGWWPVTSGVPHGPILGGPIRVLFNILIGGCRSQMHTKVVNDAKLGEAADFIKGRENRSCREMLID